MSTLGLRPLSGLPGQNSPLFMILSLLIKKKTSERTKTNNNIIKVLIKQKNIPKFLQQNVKNINIDAIINELNNQIEKEILVESSEPNRKKINSLERLQQKLQHFKNIKNMVETTEKLNFNNNENNLKENNLKENNLKENKLKENKLKELISIINKIDLLNQGAQKINQGNLYTLLNNLYESFFKIVKYNPNKKNYESLTNLNNPNSFISYLKWCIQRNLDYNSINSYIKWKKELFPENNNNNNNLVYNKLKIWNGINIIELFISIFEEKTSVNDNILTNLSEIQKIIGEFSPILIETIREVNYAINYFKKRKYNNISLLINSILSKKELEKNKKFKNIEEIITKINELYSKDIINKFIENKLNDKIYKILIDLIKNWTYYSTVIFFISSKYMTTNNDSSSFQELLDYYKNTKFKNYYILKKTYNYSNNNVEKRNICKLFQYDLENAIIKYYFAKIFEYDYDYDNTLILQIFYVIYISFITKIPLDDLLLPHSTRLISGLEIYLNNIQFNVNNIDIFTEIFQNILRCIFTPSSTAIYFPKQ